MNKKRFLTALLSSGIAAMLVLAGCEQESDSSPGKTTEYNSYFGPGTVSPELIQASADKNGKITFKSVTLGAGYLDLKSAVVVIDGFLTLDADTYLFVNSASISGKIDASVGVVLGTAVQLAKLDLAGTGSTPVAIAAALPAGGVGNDTVITGNQTLAAGSLSNLLYGSAGGGYTVVLAGKTTADGSFNLTGGSNSVVFAYLSAAGTSTVTVDDKIVISKLGIKDNLTVAGTIGKIGVVTTEQDNKTLVLSPTGGSVSIGSVTANNSQTLTIATRQARIWIYSRASYSMATTTAYTEPAALRYTPERGGIPRSPAPCQSKR